jgi:hypothetical protein
MHTMMIRPTPKELTEYGEPDFVMFNAGHFPANRQTKGMSSRTSVDLSLEDREIVILGTEYAGEMKKAIFTIAHYLAPKAGNLSMHCSATADPKSDRSSILFGLSGTGKTTLSADPKRLLVGDDEHVWTEQGIYNLEGGCYAKTIDLTSEFEPEIFHALHFGAVLENVVYGEGGTGAAPGVFLDGVGMPLFPALHGLVNILKEAGVRDRIRIFASGKLISADRQCIAFALGADACYSARGFMLALGCIQARECGSNTCPIGITTQNPKLQAGLVPAVKARRIKNYTDNTLHELEELTVAMGKACPSELTIKDLYIPTGSNLWQMIVEESELRTPLTPQQT